MLEYREMAAMLAADPSLLSPASLRLACGHDVPNKVGTPVYNYYDAVWTEQRQGTDEIGVVAVDTSGKLPNGITYWCFGPVDNSRVVCRSCGEERERRRSR
jgi:hypothetical protein